MWVKHGEHPKKEVRCARERTMIKIETHITLA
jgi:hypothetical protein